LGLPGLELEKPEDFPKRFGLSSPSSILDLRPFFIKAFSGADLFPKEVDLLDRLCAIVSYKGTMPGVKINSREILRSN